MTLIGFDFSINKPAACILQNNKCSFYGWPYNFSDDNSELFTSNGAIIIKRTDDKIKGDNASEQMRYQVKNSMYLSNLITSTLLPYLNRNTYLAFEGLSYGSSGDVVVQLGAYKYMLMRELSQYVPWENMFTYSPITVKSTAGCAKKGMGKPEMINAFLISDAKSEFRINLRNNGNNFKKIAKRTKKVSWIEHVDDLIDSYWVLETLRKKENLY